MTNDLIKQITSYNLFNYLLPGAVFCAIQNYLFNYELVIENLFVAFFFYYFVGLVISRVGSLVVEPVLKWVGVIKFRPYSDYIDACKQDLKIEGISESNNVYRTFISLPICISVYHLGILTVERAEMPNSVRGVLLMIFLCLLFAFSYRKQTAYVTARIDKAISTKVNGEEG